MSDVKCQCQNVFLHRIVCIDPLCFPIFVCIDPLCFTIFACIYLLCSVYCNYLLCSVYCIYLLYVVVAVCASGFVVREEEKDEEKRAVVMASMIATSVLAGLGSFLSGINGPNNVKDVCKYHRERGEALGLYWRALGNRVNQ